MIPNKDGIIVSPTEPTADRRKVWLQKGKNIIPTDFDMWESGKYDAVDGEKVDEPNAIRLLTLTKAEPNTVYYFNTFSSDCIFLIRTYNENGLFLRNLSQVANGTAVTTNENEKYFGVSIIDASESYTWDIYKTMFKNKILKPSIYLNEEYMNNAIYVKNHNGEYEEFIKKEPKIKWQEIALNNELFSAGTIKYAISNNMVFVHIQDLIPKENISASSTILATLPKPLTEVLFILNSFSEHYQARVRITQSGYLVPHYGGLKQGSGGLQYYGDLIYLTD